MSARILLCGDRAVSVEFGSQISPEFHRLVLGLRDRLAGLPGVVALVPTYRSLFVEYDPAEVSFEALSLAVEEAEAGLAPASVEPHRGSIEIPVLYAEPVAPDLSEVASLHGLTVAEVVALHTAPTYLVYMLGFTPGFAFLGGLDPRLHTPRLAEPRKRVAAGSVGIGGAQTGTYAIESPGGWRLIGRTPLRLFDPEAPDPTRLKPGLRVRFRAVDQEEYRRLEEGR